MRKTLVLLGLAASLTARGQSLTTRSPPQHRVVYRNLTVLRLNPLGLINETRAAYRFRLFQSEKEAFRDNFAAVGIIPALSPAYARLGALVEVQPLSVLQLWASYEVVRYFGTFSQLQSFATPGAGFSDTDLKNLAALPAGDPGRSYGVTGTQLTLGANIQAKVGPVVVRTQLRMVRPDYPLRAGDALFYDILYDVLAENRGWFLTNDADLLFQTAFGLTVGARWTATAPRYSAHVLNGEPNLNGPTHRIGPLAAYTFFQDDGARFNAPTILMAVNWWVTHRYRTGADVSMAVPYFVLGFAFTGDLIPLAP